MLCVRCSHTLPPRADRCVRCFALNPENRPAPVPRALHDSGPAAPVEVSIASDPPVAPVAICFDDERTLAPRPSAAVTEPDPEPVRTPRFALPQPPPRPEPVAAKPARLAENPERPLAKSARIVAKPARPQARPLPLVAKQGRLDRQTALPFDVAPALPFDLEPAHAPVALAVPLQAPRRVSTSARLLAWSTDAALIGITSTACIAASLRVSHVRYPLDFLRDSAPLFCALVVVIAVAYSSLLTALCGRTPGMALAGHHLRTLQGTAPTASKALLRTVLALPSAALGFFGFALALFDRRGQTLHDKLCRCVTVVD